MSEYSKEDYEAMALASGVQGFKWHDAIPGERAQGTEADYLGEPAHASILRDGYRIEWLPHICSDDFVRMQQAIIKTYYGHDFSILYDRHDDIWIIETSIFFEGFSIYSQGKTLQDAWCNLAIEIGKEMKGE